MQVLASQLHFLANKNAELVIPPLFWPVNCIKIGAHVALLSDPTACLFPILWYSALDNRATQPCRGIDRGAPPNSLQNRTCKKFKSGEILTGRGGGGSGEVHSCV